MYEIIEVSLATVSRLYDYILRGVYAAKFNIKGFDYPWLIKSRNWQKGERVLDIGGAYSELPLYLQREFGCEVWVVDDFGLLEGDSFWTRGRSPDEYIAQNPEVRYVLERVGDPQKSSLPQDYFDVVYSLSTLEHVPQGLMKNVWKHMNALLKPGGEMLHAIDLSFPSNRGVWGMVRGIVFDAIWWSLPARLRTRFCLATPKAFARFAFDALQIRFRLGQDLSVLSMTLNPDVLTEGYAIGINRIVKDDIKDYRYQRVGSLMMRLRKL
jgi:hypothetical protein